MSLAGTDLRRDILDALLAQPDWRGKQFSHLLLVHGPILPEEVDYLTSKASSGGKSVRRNATLLLGLARAPEARAAALRKLVAQSDEDGVVVLALEPLLDEPDGATLAAGRTRAIRHALGEGGPIAEMALRAAWRAGMPEVTGEIRKNLANESRSARDAATAILAKAGAGLLEVDVKAIVLDPERRRGYALIDLYQALMHSDDPSTSDVLRRSLQGAMITAELDFSNAVLLSGSRKPWLRQLLLDMAGHEGNMQWSVFDRLREWGAEAPTRELVNICADYLQIRLPKEGSGQRASGDLESCRQLLSALAGRMFGLDELHAARDFASKWQASH